MRAQRLDRGPAFGNMQQVWIGDIDGADAGAAALLARAAQGSTPTPLDRILQRHAVQLAVVVQGGDAKLIQALAKRLLPLGQIKQ